MKERESKNKPNKRFENLIKTWSPGWAAKRAGARVELEKLAQGGKYTSASRSDNVFRNIIDKITDADSSILYDRDTLVSRSRDAVRNIPVATAIPNRICDSAIGNQGLAYHSQIDRAFLNISDDAANDFEDKAEQIWKNFSESKEADLHRIQNFNEKTRLTLKSELEGADCFTLFIDKPRPGGNFNLKLQTIEGEYCSTPTDKNTAIGNIIEGVEKDIDGVRTHFHFSKFHPGDMQNLSTQEWASRKIYSPTGRLNILHHYDMIRPGQTRGIPLLGPVINKLVQLGRLTDNELMASVINSLYVIIAQGDQADTAQVKRSPGSNTKTKSSDPIDIQSGTILSLPKETTFNSFDPKRPNTNFWEFFKAIVTEIGAAIGIPRSIILGEFDKAYSASRGEVLQAWIYFLSKRTHTAVNLCQPTLEALIDEAVARGMISAPGYFLNQDIRKAYLGSAYQQWTGPTRSAIDEVKEARSFEIYHKLKTQSLKEITAKTTGKDWDKVNMQNNREESAILDELIRQNKLRVAAGLETEVAV